MAFDSASAPGRPRLTTASPPMFAVPASPTPLELARLIVELYREGTLSSAQMSAVAESPILRPLLIAVIGAVSGAAAE